MFNTPAPIETANDIAVLAVNRTPEDYEALRRILCGSKWKLHKAADLTVALRHLRRYANISLIVCDRDFWKELLPHVSEMKDGPLLIVAATDADEHLWAEALNMGAYDVLAKPFEPVEVVRSLSLGWLHRRRECERARLLRNPKVLTA